MSEYKASNGRRFTQSLFYEFNNPDAPYTLRDTDFTNRKGKTYTSMAEIYRNSVDEYDAAIKLLGSWPHWEMLLKLDWFMNGTEVGGTIFEGVKAWREEMSKRDASKAKEQLQKAAVEGNIAAQKYLHDQSGKVKGAGRPEKKVTAKKESSVVEAFKRIQGGAS